MNYGDFKEVPRRTASDKLLGNKVFNIAESAQYDGHKNYFCPMVYSFLIKGLQVVQTVTTIDTSAIIQNQKLA